MSKSDKAKKQLKAYTEQLIPEIRSEMATLQPMDYNPYERLGPLPPNNYNYWNRSAGYQDVEPYFDPE